VRRFDEREAYRTRDRQLTPETDQVGSGRAEAVQHDDERPSAAAFTIRSTRQMDAQFSEPFASHSLRLTGRRQREKSGSVAASKWAASLSARDEHRKTVVAARVRCRVGPMPPIDQLCALLRQARRALIFTGAGISTASNIPDFRGPAGVWQRRQPVYYSDFVASDAARREYWDFKLEGYRAFRDAQPNAAHRAIVELEHMGKLESLVTQNVDGLHQRAGSSAERLVELHGTNLEIECIECARREPPERCMLEFERTKQPPRCSDCSGFMKPAVIMFGQSLDLEVLERARRAAERADLVLSLGSSLVVTPAADVPLHAARRGAPYVIINQGETPHDRIATLCIDADVSDLLPACLPAVRES
jgi:NAD-dependent deacetylase